MKFKHLCIFENSVYEIPSKYYKMGEVTKKEFANQELLMMGMAYETKDRKPNRLYEVNFSKAPFDAEGTYSFKKRMLSDEFKSSVRYSPPAILVEIAESFFNFEKEPLPIPFAPTIPNKREIHLFKSYINKKYPSLLADDSSLFIELTILQSVERHKENLRKFKESHKRKHNLEKTK